MQSLSLRLGKKKFNILLSMLQKPNKGFAQIFGTLQWKSCVHTHNLVLDLCCMQSMSPSLQLNITAEQETADTSV